MKGQSTIFFLLIAVSLILSAAGCASTTSLDSSPTPGTARTDFPSGTFLWPGDDPLGGYRIEYKADGSYVYSGHGGGATGKYTMTGDQVLFLDNWCGNVKGIYTWAFDGEMLTFRLLDDNCAERSQVLSNSSWKESP